MKKTKRKPKPQPQIADTIRAECVRRGWSVAELARRAGLSRTTAHQLTCGNTRRPQIATLRKVAGAFELPIEKLLNPGSTDFAARSVELSAEAINRRRETVRKLQVVLETELREEAIQFVDLLYRMVQPAQASRSASATARESG